MNPEILKNCAVFSKLIKTKSHEIWIILIKKKCANPQPISFNEAVTEAVEQGLIDSRTKTLNEQKYAIRFTKRKPKSSDKISNVKAHEFSANLKYLKRTFLSGMLKWL